MRLAQRGLIVENASEKKKKEKKSVAKDTQAGRQVNSDRLRQRLPVLADEHAN